MLKSVGLVGANHANENMDSAGFWVDRATGDESPLRRPDHTLE